MQLRNTVRYISVLLVVAPISNGCVFNCNDPSSICGGRKVEYLSNTVSFVTSIQDPGVVFVPARTLDLSNRGITSIAPGGLQCYFSVHPGGDDVFHQSQNSTHIQAVLLDNNRLTDMPDTGEFDGAGIISLRNNTIDTLKKNAFMNFIGGNRVLLVYLENNQITSVQPGAFAGFDETGTLNVFMSHNNVTSISNTTFSEFNGLNLRVSLSNNRVTSIQEGAFQLWNGSQTLAVNLENNFVTWLPPNLFAGFDAESLTVSLGYNQIESLNGGLCNGFTGRTLVLELQENHLHTLEQGAFNNFGGQFLNVSLRNNKLVTPGPVFVGYAGYGACSLDFTNNSISAVAVKECITSFQTSQASLTLDFSYNNVDYVPSQLLDSVGRFTASGIFVIVQVNLSHNPITYIDANAFNTNENNAYLFSLELDLSNPTAGIVRAPPVRFVFGDASTGIVWFIDTGGEFTINLANTGLPLSIVRLLTDNVYGPATVNVGLRHNNYTQIGAGAFEHAFATSLDLSHNAITSISPTAFNYSDTFRLKTLDLSNNRITAIEIGVISNLLLVQTMNLSQNVIWALPLIGMHIFSSNEVAHNTIVCATYGPVLKNCRCEKGRFYTEHCGYGRCTLTPSGCPKSEFNTSGCSEAPSSECISSCSHGEYFEVNAQSCLPSTNCSKAFANRGTTVGYVEAYQVYDSTPTSNRECSICSTCPDGYDTSPCTATTDSKCTRSKRLTGGDVAAIVLSVLILAVTAFISWVYGRTQSKARVKTKGELELTELLLGDVTEEKDRVTEERQRMQQAWSIEEADLQIGSIIGRGAFGNVFAGMWGHIPVAVKVLKMAFDDLDPILVEDFDREVTFMQSIRHPNLLTFYGAGVNSKRHAFLVTEMMAGGSLRTQLLDMDRVLTWKERLSFVVDIARGMKYLHEKGTIHRDLKADNCFVDTQLRVKVADFGTGKIQTQFESGSRSAAPTSTSASGTHSGVPAIDHPRTLTKGIGSLLWMAPEVLRGEKISASHGAALDVYSFAIVMWEIWARARPWDEVEGTGITFTVTLEQLVSTGVRPQLPDGVDPSPPGYREVMERCWSTRATERPSFAVTLDSLTLIVAELGSIKG
eukprot:m.72564 g.72564  ORF g.72564 m.72564 type:complete len:1102 (+) comp24465_c0_seq1:285-3590(+)